MIKGIFLFVDHSRTQSEWQYLLAKKYWFLPINLIKAGGREEGGVKGLYDPYYGFSKNEFSRVRVKPSFLWLLIPP